MNQIAIERQFRSSVGDSIRLLPEGKGRYRVLTPYRLEDGDHLCVVLRRDDGQWVLSDEGHTFMHLTYDMDERDFRDGKRGEIVETALRLHGVTDQDGQLVIPVEGQRFGDALFSYVQALSRVCSVSLLSREVVRNTFVEDVISTVRSVVPESRVVERWHDPKFDPGEKYLVDIRINGMPSPLFVYALANDERTRDATISVLQFERWQIPFRVIAIFENQAEIGRKVLARFSDVCDKQFSNLPSNRARINDYILKHLDDGGSAGGPN